jgi:hypothetical protein
MTINKTLTIYDAFGTYAAISPERYQFMTPAAVLERAAALQRYGEELMGNIECTYSNTVLAGKDTDLCKDCRMVYFTWEAFTCTEEGNYYGQYMNATRLRMDIKLGDTTLHTQTFSAGLAWEVITPEINGLPQYPNEVQTALSPEQIAKYGSNWNFRCISLMAYLCKKYVLDAGKELCPNPSGITVLLYIYVNSAVKQKEGDECPDAKEVKGHWGCCTTECNCLNGNTKKINGVTIYIPSNYYIYNCLTISETTNGVASGSKVFKLTDYAGLTWDVLLKSDVSVIQKAEQDAINAALLYYGLSQIEIDNSAIATATDANNCKYTETRVATCGDYKCAKKAADGTFYETEFATSLTYTYTCNTNGLSAQVVTRVFDLKAAFSSYAALSEDALVKLTTAAYNSRVAALKTYAENQMGGGTWTYTCTPVRTNNACHTPVITAIGEWSCTGAIGIQTCSCQFNIPKVIDGTTYYEPSGYYIYGWLTTKKYSDGVLVDTSYTDLFSLLDPHPQNWTAAMHLPMANIDAAAAASIAVATTNVGVTVVVSNSHKRLATEADQCNTGSETANATFSGFNCALDSNDDNTGYRYANTLTYVYTYTPTTGSPVTTTTVFSILDAFTGYSAITQDTLNHYTNAQYIARANAWVSWCETQV